MPVIVITALATVPEPSNNRHAQRDLLGKVNAILDSFEAEILALGGVAQTEHTTKREAGKRDLTPPPTPPAPSGETDMVTLAQIGSAVADAATPPPPAPATEPHDKLHASKPPLRAA